MKRTLIMTSLAGCWLVFPDAAVAQETTGVDTPKLLSWAYESPPDVFNGALFAAAGLIGALVTIFTLIGGAIPGTAGQAAIDRDDERLERLTQRLEELIRADRVDGPGVAAVEKTVDNLRDDLRSERRRQFALATGIYAVLGMAFAVLLAQDVLQALLIGAGWTGLLGALGLKSDFAERKAAKDTAIDVALARAHRFERAVKEESDKTPADLGLQDSSAAETTIRVARRL